MHDECLARRRFLVAAVTCAGVQAIPLTATWLKVGASWAANADGRDATTTLARLAQLLFPHPGLNADVYAEIMSAALAQTAADPATREALDSVAAALDAARDTDWFDLDADEQLQVMADLQEAAFFASIREMVRFRLYYHPALWNLIGYPGSSKEYGGYIERGFDDIDWLPGES